MLTERTLVLGRPRTGREASPPGQSAVRGRSADSGWCGSSRVVVGRLDPGRQVVGRDAQQLGDPQAYDQGRALGRSGFQLLDRALGDARGGGYVGHADAARLPQALEPLAESFRCWSSHACARPTPSGSRALVRPSRRWATGAGPRSRAPGPRPRSRRWPPEAWSGFP
jgi:hypothetical protein